MIFSAVDPPNTYGKGKIHCELVYTTDPDMASNWTRVSPGSDFIPLGVAHGVGKGDWDSHICFATAHQYDCNTIANILYGWRWTSLSPF